MGQSADGSTLAYSLGDDGLNRIAVMVNEVPGPFFKQVGTPMLSADGSTVAYRATEDGDSWFIVKNGKRASPVSDSLTDPALSRDGSVLAFAAENEKSFIFVGHQRIEIPRMPRSVFLSHDGGSWGYVTRDAVVTPHGTSETFDEIRRPEFSPDGRHVLFGGRKGEQWFVVAAGRKFESPGLVGEPIWSADGRQIGYGALLGREVWWKIISLE